jgi:hypothetical protein
MDSTKEPAARIRAVAGVMTDAKGRQVAFSVQSGSVVITAEPHSGRLGRVDLETPGQWSEYLRNLVQAFRVARPARRVPPAGSNAPRGAAGPVGEWVLVETRESAGEARMRADHDCLHIDGLAWSYLGADEWEKFSAAGDAIFAGMRGRKMLALACELDERDEVDGLARGCFGFPDQLPPAEEWTDEQWAHVAHVLRSSGSFGLLKEWWDAAGVALAGTGG